MAKRFILSLPDFDPTIHIRAEMVADLVKAGTLAPEIVKPLVEELKQAEGFLSARQLGQIIKKYIKGKDEADAVYRVLRNIPSDRLSTLIENLDEWRREEENQETLSEELFEQVKKGLKSLIIAYPALERYRKAERLEDITGKSLEEIEMICDIRPIFDEKREQIEGMIPYTRLKLVIEGDGSSESVEAELSAQQVTELVKKAQMAQKKLECLRSHINQWIPNGIPDVERAHEPQDKEIRDE